MRQMTFARSARCPCGALLAYDETCVQEPFVGPSYWDCSAILDGTAIPSGQPGAVEHTDKLPFAFYDIKAETPAEALARTTGHTGEATT